MNQQPDALANRPNLSGSGAALWLGGLFVLMVTVSLPASGVPAPSAQDCTIPIEVSARKDWTTHAACSEGDVDGRDIRGPARLLFGRTLDLNVADVRALQVLPGIGPFIPGRGQVGIMALQHDFIPLRMANVNGDGIKSGGGGIREPGVVGQLESAEQVRLGLGQVARL